VTPPDVEPVRSRDEDVADGDRVVRREKERSPRAAGLLVELERMAAGHLVARRDRVERRAHDLLPCGLVSPDFGAVARRELGGVPSVRGLRQEHRHRLHAAGDVPVECTPETVMLVARDERVHDDRRTVRLEVEASDLGVPALARLPVGVLRRPPPESGLELADVHGVSLPRVRVERSMHPEWLSNAYLVWDEDNRAAFFVDSGAPLEPLLEVVEREGLDVRALLTTHTHHDHVAGDAELERRFGIASTQAVDWAQGIPTPGHADDHVTFVVGGLCFSGDLLFKDAVGGGDAAAVRESVFKLLDLADEMRVLPGHTEETTIGREREENPFLRYWLGAAPSIDESVRVGGEDATLVVWSPDYDGKGKALVRFGDGRERIVGGSRVERSR
jgi:hydroxyacylglutathione hydrolase